VKIEIKSAVHRKIPVANILANPHRDLSLNPIIPERVEGLLKSMEQTGFWDNIVVRPHPTKEDKYQAAFGHNRLAALNDERVNVTTITIPVVDLSDWQMYEAMVSENELAGRVTPAVAIENVNVGCDMVERALKKIGKKGTWEDFNSALGKATVSVDTVGHTNGSFERVRNAFFNGEGLGRQFLIAFLPCGDMRSATIQEIVSSRYGEQKAKVKAAEAKRLAEEAEELTKQGKKDEAKKAKAKADKADKEAEQASKGFSQDVLRKFKRARTATDFCKAAREIGIPKSHHVAAADHIVQYDISGERMIASSLGEWWRGTKAAEASGWKPGPKSSAPKEKDKPQYLAGMQFDADLAQIGHLLRKMKKTIEPIAAQMSEAWAEGTTEELLQVQDELKQLLDLVRKTQPNKRGHIHVVKGGAA